MSFLVKIMSTGAVHYYINGRRVTRDRQDQAKFGRQLSSFRTIIRGGTVRHYCKGSER